MKLVIKDKRDQVKKKSILIYTLLYSLSLFTVYYFELSHVYAYAQMTFTPNYLKMIITVLFVLITIIFFPTDKNKPSTYLYYMIYIATYLPTAMFYWMANKPTLYILYETICMIVIALMLKWNHNQINIKQENGVVLIDFIFIVYVISCVVLVIRNRGIHISALLADLYQVRSENNISGVFGYLLNWCAKSFMPFYFIFFYLKKKYWTVVFVSVLQIFLFLSYGFKSFIMAVFLLVFISYLTKKPSSYFKNISFSFSIINIISILLVLAGSITLLKLFPYRTLFLPAQGQFAYYDFFTHHDYLYFSEGIIGRFLGIKYPYLQQIGRIVNIYIYGPQKLSNGNTGIFSYGYADFGFLGMCLSSLIIGFVFNIIDSSTKNLPISIPISAMAYQMLFVVNDNSMLISLNTGGIFWSVIMLIFLNSVYLSIREDNVYTIKR